MILDWTEKQRERERKRKRGEEGRENSKNQSLFVSLNLKKRVSLLYTGEITPRKEMMLNLFWVGDEISQEGNGESFYDSFCIPSDST